MADAMISLEPIAMDFSDLDLDILDLNAVEIIEANDSVGMPAYGASCAGWVTSCSCSLCRPRMADEADG